MFRVLWDGGVEIETWEHAECLVNHFKGELKNYFKGKKRSLAYLIERHKVLGEIMD